MRRMMRVVAVAGGLVVAVPLFAQTPAPTTGEEISVWQGGAVKVTKQTTLAGDWTCNLTPAPAVPAPLVNPTTIQISDPDPTHVNKACQTSQVAMFRALMAGTGYTVIVTPLSAGMPAPADRAAMGTVAIPDFQVAPIFTPPLPATGVLLLSMAK